MTTEIDDFSEQKECHYKNEKYSARNNGAVLRHPLNDNKPRPNDNIWTFGKLNKETGYLEISTVRIHRIIATAFLGEPPTDQYVVDHIDTNRQNNRPENLRWVTKLEHVLNNPITRKRITLICGSLEAFLENPSLLRDYPGEPNFKWMRTVSAEEAANCKHKLLEWAQSEKKPIGGKLGEWIYQTPSKETNNNKEISQKNWATKTQFPNCPQNPSKDPILSYKENLKEDSVFARNQYGESKVLKTAIKNDGKVLLVLTVLPSGIKNYALAKVTFENGTYIHESLRTFFELIGAEKQFTINQGLEWTGEDSIDDYC